MTDKTDIDLLNDALPSSAYSSAEPETNWFEGVTFSYFQNEIPPFVESEMERLYGNLYSSIPLFRMRKVVGDAHTYVDWKDGTVTAILVFRRVKGIVTVLNELVRLPAESMQRFVSSIFSAAPDVRCIVFNAIETGKLNMDFPVQRFNCSENIVISLPASAEAYFDSLSRNLRKNLDYHSRRIRREHPSYEYRTMEGEGIDETCIRRIAEFNQARMAGKNKASGTTEQEIRKILAMVRTFDGFVGISTVDGRMCAGEICCRVGSNYFILMGAHKPAFDKYRLGMISQYMTICEIIRRGGRECHFTWGREEYKYRLRGVRRDLDRIVVYRSHAQMLLNAGLAARTCLNGRIRRLKLRLLDPAHKDMRPVRLANGALRAIRDWMQRMRGTSSPP